MSVEVIGSVCRVETIAVGSGIREIARLRRAYGAAPWRKRKGVARVRLADGEVRLAEIPWYEAHGVGRREVKVERILDRSP